MTEPENPYFARSITNRVWANFFGRGLVEQVDDLRLSNPASNEALLDAAAQHVVDADFDLKQLMRTILRSETYQRSSVALEANRSEEKYLSRYYPRRLMAEVLLDSIDQVLGTATKFDQIAFPGAGHAEDRILQRGDAGHRAIRLGGELVFPEDLWTQPARDHMRVRTERRAEAWYRFCTFRMAIRSTRNYRTSQTSWRE